MCKKCGDIVVISHRIIYILRRDEMSTELPESAEENVFKLILVSPQKIAKTIFKSADWKSNWSRSRTPRAQGLTTKA